MISLTHLVAHIPPSFWSILATCMITPWILMCACVVLCYTQLLNAHSYAKAHIPALITVGIEYDLYQVAILKPVTQFLSPLWVRHPHLRQDWGVGSVESVFDVVQAGAAAVDTTKVGPRFGSEHVEPGRWACWSMFIRLCSTCVCIDFFVHFVYLYAY